MSDWLMDNLCHSLAGAVIAESGFAQRTRFATAALVVAANIPDVDVGYLFAGDLAGLEGRRGWTHGIPALIAWPFVVVGATLLWHRFVRRGAQTDQPINIQMLLLGCALAVFSHPALDWLNTYGVRFLMPFSDRWFYGDTLFIVDLMLLILFAAGWWISRRSRLRELSYSTRAARTAVVLALIYIVLMKTQSERSKASLTSVLELKESGPKEVMLAPLPVTMRSRNALVVTDSGYQLRRVRAGIVRMRVDSVHEYLPTQMDHPLSRLARETDEYRRFARWSRFPYFIPNPDGDTASVFVGDARYTRGSSDSWAGVRIRVR